MSQDKHVCNQCENAFDVDNVTASNRDTGHCYCDSCIYDQCSHCNDGVPDHEISNGDYICQLCYESFMDGMYERVEV